MKKFITLILLLASFVMQAQYINHQKILIDASVGYGFSVGTKSNSKNNNFDAESFSGLMYDLGVFYRTSFGSRSLVGIRANFINGKQSSHITQFAYEPTIYYTDNKHKSLFVGPSYLYEFTNFQGTLSNSLQLTPGYMFLTNDISINNKQQKINASGFAFGLNAIASYKIVEHFELFVKIGGNYALISEFDDASAEEIDGFLSDHTKFNIFRFEGSGGLRIKFL